VKLSLKWDFQRLVIFLSHLGVLSIQHLKQKKHFIQVIRIDHFYFDSFVYIRSRKSL